MRDPRWHFKYKYKVSSNTVDNLIRLHFVHKHRICEVYDNMNRDIQKKVNYEALRYLLNRYKKYLNWLKADKVDSQSWGE